MTHATAEPGREHGGVKETGRWPQGIVVAQAVSSMPPLWEVRC